MGSSALTDATAAIDSGVKAPGYRDFSSAKVRGRGLGSSRTPKRLSWTSTAYLDMPRSTLLYSENSVLPVRYSSSCSQSPPPLQPSWTALKHQKESEEENPPMLGNGFTMTEEPVIFLHFFF